MPWGEITGAASPTITTLVLTVHGAEHEVIPDRIEAATRHRRGRTAK
jgi:UDP-N-acetylglucosamine enolpyruvyl transferase